MGTDSHLALPVIGSAWARLDSIELVPFRAAIDAGVGAVMSAHIALPEIDRGELRPVTMAPGVLTGILRDSLKFDGLVVTDALDMGAVVNGYGADASVRAFIAGADLLLQPADPAAAIDAMAAAVTAGTITPERLDRSVRRVLQIKRDLGLFTRRTVALDSVPEIVGSARFLEEARDDGRPVGGDGEGRERHRARPPRRAATDHGGDLRGRGESQHRARPDDGTAETGIRSRR